MSQVLQRWEEFGVASTSTVVNGICIQGVVEGVRNDQGESEIHINARTTNFAMFDEAQGAVYVSLLMNSTSVASYSTTCPRNPGRGFAPPTVRQGLTSAPLPKDVTFNRIGLRFVNLDDPVGGTVDWSKVIELGALISSTTLEEV